MKTNKRVMVFGSYVTDLCGRTNVFPKAGETVKGNSFKMGPGGKGSNQAVAAKRAGADVTFITKLGNDPLGREALAFYQSEGMSTGQVLIDNSRPTGAALIIVNEESAQNQIVVVSGACGNFTPDDMEKILPQLEQTDILLIQLETNLEPVKEMLKQAAAAGIYTILNPAPAALLEKEYYPYINIITPNETEAQILTGVKISNMNDASRAAGILMSWGVEKVVITMGGDGAYAFDGQRECRQGIIKCGAIVDTTGAGDAFSGGLAAALARGYGFFDAVKYGSCVAGLAVTRYGTAPAMPYREEIEKIYQAV